MYGRLKAQGNAHNLVNVIEEVQNGEKYNILFVCAVSLAKSLDIQPQKLRTMGRQCTE